MDETKIAMINEARTASVFLSWAQPIFEEVQKDLLNSLKSNFRAGTYTELLLACHVAQLVSLDDLQIKIKSIAARSHNMREKLDDDFED